MSWSHSSVHEWDERGLNASAACKSLTEWNFTFLSGLSLTGAGSCWRCFTRGLFSSQYLWHVQTLCSQCHTEERFCLSQLLYLPEHAKRLVINLKTRWWVYSQSFHKRFSQSKNMVVYNVYGSHFKRLAVEIYLRMDHYISKMVINPQETECQVFFWCFTASITCIKPFLLFSNPWPAICSVILCCFTKAKNVF